MPLQPVTLEEEIRLVEIFRSRKDVGELAANVHVETFVREYNARRINFCDQCRQELDFMRTGGGAVDEV